MKRAFFAVALLLFASSAFAQDKVQPPTTPLGAGRGLTTLAITWNAPGDACTNAQVAEYDLRWSTTGAITECTFTDASALSVPSAASPGTQHCVAVSGLTCATTYYFAFKSKDSAGNWSDISTLAVATKACNTTPEVDCE